MKLIIIYSTRKIILYLFLSCAPIHLAFINILCLSLFTCIMRELICIVLLEYAVCSCMIILLLLNSYITIVCILIVCSDMLHLFSVQLLGILSYYDCLMCIEAYLHMTHFKIRSPSSDHFFQKIKFEYMPSYTYFLCRIKL